MSGLNHCGKCVAIQMAMIGEKRWIVMGCDNELVVFKGEYEKEPLIMSLNGKIRAVSISPAKRYLTVAVNHQINIYEIKKATNLVLIKNFSDLKIGVINHLVCY